MRVHGGRDGHGSSSAAEAADVSGGSQLFGSKDHGRPILLRVHDKKPTSSGGRGNLQHLTGSNGGLSAWMTEQYFKWTMEELKDRRAKFAATCDFYLSQFSQTRPDDSGQRNPSLGHLIAAIILFAIALFKGYHIMAHIAGAGSNNGESDSVVYHVLSVFIPIFLHLLEYVFDTFLWKQTGIDYIRLFEFDSTEELKYMEMLLFCTISPLVVVVAMCAYSSLIEKGHSSRAVQAIPAILILMFLFVLMWILYRSSGYRHLKIIRNILYRKGGMVEAFMVDQLCSQAPMLRSLGYVTCYYGSCMKCRWLIEALPFLPFFLRAKQCLVWWWLDEQNTSHLINLGKYVSSMAEVGVRMKYEEEKEKSVKSFTLVLLVSTLASFYQLYWDSFKDWGLLQFNSRNLRLRNRLMLQKKCIYLVCLVLNFVLRFAWLPTVLIYYYAGPGYSYSVTSFIMAALEVVRRGIWNFFRLEYEHVNKYLARDSSEVDPV